MSGAADLEVLPTEALEAFSKSEIDIQVATARKFRRSPKLAMQEAIGLASMSQEIAEDCYYRLKRKDNRTGETKVIEGPSIRLAEIVAMAWGNLRWGNRVVADDGNAVTQQGFCWDLEKNVARLSEVRRRVTTRDGKRYSDDMVTVTSNAAGAIAARNAVLAVIPRTFVDQVMAAAQKVAQGDAATLPLRRQRAVEHFEKLGVDRAWIFARYAARGLEDLTLEHVEDLQGIKTALKDGQTTIAEEFPPPVVAGPSGVGAAVPGDRATQLAEKIRGARSDATGDVDATREPGAEG